MKKILTLASLLFLTCLTGITNAEIPEDSIYQLDTNWVDQNNKPVNLKQLAGKKQLVAMIYTHCLHACPIIVSAMKAFETALPAEQRKDYGFVLVSLTPDSDTPAVLKEFAEKRDLNEKNWTLLSGDQQDVRSLAMTLGIQYRPSEDDQLAHSNVYTLLDAKGRKVLQEIATIPSAKALAKAQ